MAFPNWDNASSNRPNSVRDGPVQRGAEHASGDDRDFSPESEWGWWLYFNFEADEVPFTPATAAPVVSAAPIRTAALATSPNPFSERVSFSVSVPEGPLG